MEWRSWSSLGGVTTNPSRALKQEGQCLGTNLQKVRLTKGTLAALGLLHPMRRPLGSKD